MTYAAFLLQFLVVPIVILGVLVYRDRRRLLTEAFAHGLLSPRLALAALVVIAVTLYDALG